MARDTEYLVCPLCGVTWAVGPGALSLKLSKNLSPDADLIHVKRALGSAGFSTVGTVSIADAVRDPQYRSLVEDMRRRCQRFLALTAT